MLRPGPKLLAALLLFVGACADKTLQFADAGPGTSADAMDLTPVDAGLDGAVGRPGQATISGAIKASSPNYKLYGTLRSGDGSSESPGYLRRGGVTGATQP
jgi:hypothetical protein